MFRLYKAELKKIFLKPSIFVVTGLIILMLAVSTFLYNPDTKSNYSKNYANYPTVTNYYNKFTTGNSGTLDDSSDKASLFIKSTALSNIQSAKEYLQNYLSATDAIQELKNRWNAIEKLYDDSGTDDYRSLHEYWKINPTTSRTDLENKRAELINAITNFENAYKSYAAGSASGSATSFLVSNDLDKRIEFEHFTKINIILDITTKDDPVDPDEEIINELDNYEFSTVINNDLNQLLPFKPDESLLAELSLTKVVDGETVENEESPIVIAEKRMAEIENKIVACYNAHVAESETSAQKDRDEIIEYIQEYYETSLYCFKIVEDGIKLNGLSKYATMNITNFKTFERTNFYELSEKLAKNKYLFNSQTYAYQYADPFSVIQPSNQKINGFDYSYFALRLCTFFITVYIVVLAGSTIAGEQSSGTLKLLAIRPYSRRKLLSAKILATLAIGAILIFVSSIASLVVGGVTYGFNFTDILVVFNASHAFALNPILVYLIAMLTMFVEVAFYAMLSIFISTVFKSNIAAVSISTLIFFVSLVINFFATQVPLLGLIPFVNVNFFKYFGSSFLANSFGIGTDSLIHQILTPTVFTGSTFFTSILIYVLTISIVTVVTYVVFKKRDIK